MLKPNRYSLLLMFGMLAATPWLYAQEEMEIDEWEFELDSGLEGAFESNDHHEVAEAEGAATENRRRFPIKYMVSTDQSYRHTESTTIDRQRAALSLVYEQSLASGFYVNADLRLVNYFARDAQARLEGSELNDLRVEQFWVQYSNDECMSQIGMQKLIWGVVEGAFVTDIVTPIDYTEPLLTDFSLIRRSQLMLLGNCYWGEMNRRQYLQLFLTPNAHYDRFGIKSNLGYPDSSERSEWGGRWHGRFGALELSLMAAQLIPNIAMPAETPSRDRLLGATLVWGRGQWLWQSEYVDQSQRQGYALGLEYRTNSNHLLLVGLTNIDAAQQSINSMLLTGGGVRYLFSWQKQYLHDDLALNALLLQQKSQSYPGAPSEKSSGLTFMAQLRLNDYWQISSALSYLNFEDDHQSAVAFSLVYQR